MMKHPAGESQGLRLYFLLGLVCMLLYGCCPTGAYEDNFGRFYILLSVPTEDFFEPFNTFGQVDTREDFGCGIWQIEAIPPLDPETNPISFKAVNPNQNTADQCCWEFRFDGRIAGSGCSVLLGEYQNLTLKCEGGSGQMFLQTAE